MKANVIMPEIREGTEKDVKVDASSVPDVCGVARHLRRAAAGDPGVLRAG